MSCNQLKSLDYKTISLYIFAYLFFSSCTSIPSSPASASVSNTNNVKNAQAYQTQVSSLKSLMLPQSDFETARNLSGFIWSPFVLPLQNLTVTNASLFVGHREIKEDVLSANETPEIFTPPPDEGSCKIFHGRGQPRSLGSSGKVTSSEASLAKNSYVFINKTKQKRLNTSFFLILDGETHEPVAFARLNAKGESACQLPVQPYAISMGFGRYRHETHIDGKSKIVNLKFPSLSSIRVNPTAKSNIQNGDLIRIGRKFNLEFTKQGSGQLPDLHVASKIREDLYSHADMMSHDFAVDEYLKTSFLVGQSRYQIELESGNYVVAVLRKNKLLCVNKIKLNPDSSYDVSCRENVIALTKEDIAYQFENEDTSFDVGFRPESLIRNKDFVNWTVATAGTILLGPPMIDVNSTFDPSAFNEEDFFSLIYKNKAGSGVSQTSYGASFSECINTFKLPLVGMDKTALIEGQAPFSEYVRASSQKYFMPYFLNYTNVIHTNGVEITVLEPILTNTGVLFATNDQNFLIRIAVPKWNSSQLLEMYVNNKLSKRWILKRGEISQQFATNVKVNTYETENFTVKFIARGESPLPNFITGRESFLPFAETREFCVSLDGKDKCL